MNELKPCPFCGGTAKKVYKSSGQTTHIECEQCRAQFPKSTNENAFDEAWNSRVERTCKMNRSALQKEGYPSLTTYTCSVCGMGYLSIEAPERGDYCKGCGARVVE